MKKLLILSHNPNRASFRQRIGVYLPRLQAEGIDCTVIRIPSKYIPRWRLLKRVGDYDGVFLQKSTLNFFDAFLVRSYSKKLIYDFDDAIMYDPNNPFGSHSSHPRQFRRTIKLADIVIAGNPYLADRATMYRSRILVLPTGLDVSKYASVPPPISDGKIRLVWIGSTSTLKYLRDIIPTLEQIGRRFPHVILKVICDSFFDLSSLPVEKCVWTAANEAIDLASCDIGLAPLPNDPFTKGKCGYKILQYFACGLPVVGSPVGMNTQLIEEGKCGFLADNPDQWLARLSQLIDNVDLRRIMGKEGRSYVFQYDLDPLGRKLVDIVANWLSESSREIHE